MSVFFVVLFCLLCFASILPFLLFSNCIARNFFIFLSLSVSSTSSLSSPCVEHTYSEKHSKKNSVSLVQKKKLIRIMGKKKGKAKKKTKKKVIKVHKIHFYKPFSITENSIHTTHTHI